MWLWSACKRLYISKHKWQHKKHLTLTVHLLWNSHCPQGNAEFICVFEDDTFAEGKTFRLLFVNVASLSLTSSGRDRVYKGAFKQYNVIKSGFMERSFPAALSGAVITCNMFSSLLLSFLISWVHDHMVLCLKLPKEHLPFKAWTMK